MGSAPPAGGVGGIAAMGGPAIGPVFLQPVKLSHVLREAHCLEDSHVLSAGEDVGPVYCGVDVHHHPGDVLILVHLHGGQHAPERGDEIAPDQGLIRNGGDGAGGNGLPFHQLQSGSDIRFALLPGLQAVIKEVQGKELLILRIDAISRKAAPQPVGPLVHGLHALDDLLSAHAFPASGDHRRDGAAGGVAEFAFFLTHGLHLPSTKKGAKALSGHRKPDRAPLLCPYHTPTARACQCRRNEILTKNRSAGSFRFFAN